MNASTKTFDVVVLPGDGIGPEVMEQALKVREIAAGAAGVSMRTEIVPCGGGFYLEHGSRDWPEGAEERCEAADLILLGAVGLPDPKGKGPVTMSDGRMAGWSPVIGNRIRLGLYANIRPVRLFPGIRHGISGRARQVWEPEKVDLVIVRENTECLYSGLGGIEEKAGGRREAVDTRIITEEASRKVIRRAFDLSMDRGHGAPEDGKRRVTCIVKDNLLFGCKLFAEVFEEVGEGYPEVEKEKAIVDAFTVGLVSRPEHYDVCVTTNMFGDIVTDLAAVLQGGMGLAVGCNIGHGHAMFEPIHGSAPDIAGEGIANPLAMILAAGEGLSWLARRHEHRRLLEAASKIDEAVRAVILAGAPLTRDISGTGPGATTAQVGAAVAGELLSRV